MSEQPDHLDEQIQGVPEGSALADLHILGLPGPFTAWGVEFVRQILGHAGYATEIVPTEDKPWHPVDVTVSARRPPGDDAPATGSSTIVFLDEAARAAHTLLSAGHDTMDATRVLTACLSRLQPILRAPGVLLVQRVPEMDLAAARHAITRHLLPALTPASDPFPAEATFDGSAPVPTLTGSLQSLTRQLLTPLTNLVIGTSRAPLTWPLACFYSGNHPGEVAAPVIDVSGPARALYYGPYFYLPAGKWRADVQLVFFENLHDTILAVDVAGREKLGEVRVRAQGTGLYQVPVPFSIDSMEDQLEVRIWLTRGALEGLLGFSQVVMNFIED
jgi:hypothetical protein